MTDQEYLGIIEKLEYLLDMKFHGSTAAEKAIYYYFYDYLWLNEDLRLGRDNFHADFISRFLQSIKPYQGTLYRGGYFLLKDIEDNYKIGSEILWRGFTSASLDLKIAKEFADKADKVNKAASNFVKCIFIINSKKAKPVYNLFPDILGRAREHIFDRGSKFRVKEVVQDQDYYLISLDEI